MTAANNIKQLPVRLRKDPDGLAKALELLDVTWRWNLRAQRREYSMAGGDWEPGNDLFEDRLRLLIEKDFVSAGADGKTAPLNFGQERWTACLNSLMHDFQVDPFRQWLEDLPTWDGTRRLDHWMTWCFEVHQPDCELIRWASSALFLGCVWRTFHPGCKIDEMVVLHGPQGCGKSTALRWMFPVDHPEWFGDGLHLAADTKQRTEALLGKVLVEASELAGSNRAELESLKAFLSRTDDGGIRLAYRRNPEFSLPRRCVIAGTMNHDGLPNDPTGNRRFVVVKVQPGEYNDKYGAEGVRFYLDTCREALWAEALARYGEGEEAWLPQNLAPVQAMVNEDYRRRDDIIEDMLTDWLTTGMADFTTGEAAVGIGLVKAGEEARVTRRDQMRIGAVLTLLGCTKHRKWVDVKRRRLWSVPTCPNLP